MWESHNTHLCSCGLLITVFLFILCATHSGVDSQGDEVPLYGNITDPVQSHTETEVDMSQCDSSEPRELVNGSPEQMSDSTDEAVPLNESSYEPTVQRHESCPAKVELERIQSEEDFPPPPDPADMIPTPAEEQINGEDPQGEITHSCSLTCRSYVLFIHYHSCVLLI